MAKSRTIRRSRARGVTLFEVLVVVAILALVAGGVGVAAISEFDRARRRTAQTSGRDLRRSVKIWWTNHETSECPQIDRLIEDGTLDRDGARQDPWGGEWHIECAGDEVTVTSKGRDRVLGTEDDIRVPPT